MKPTALKNPLNYSRLSHWLGAALFLLSSLGCFNIAGVQTEKIAEKEKAAENNKSGPGSQETNAKIVAAKEENGAVIGLISKDESSTQILNASPGSAISGSSVAFPPGSLGIDTEVTMKAGQTLATNDTAGKIGLSTSFATSAPAVEIRAGTAIDAAKPFTLSIPIPASASLTTEDGDPFVRLVVIYKIKKADTGKEFTGVMIRNDLNIESSFVKIVTSNFGSYQAAFTVDVVREAPAEREVSPVNVSEDTSPAAVETSNTTVDNSNAGSSPHGASKKRYYIRGVAVSSFGNHQSKVNSQQLWNLGVSIPSLENSVGFGPFFRKESEAGE